MTSGDSDSPGASDATLWSKIVRAGDSQSSRSQEEKEWLYQTYRPSVLAYLHRSGFDHEQCRDITQDFFLYFLKKNLAAVADPYRGRFRSFLLGTLKNFLSNERQRARTAKRGGAAAFIAWEVACEGGVDWKALSNGDTPERAFDRRWALTVLEETMGRMAGEYERGGRQAEFEVLRPFLVEGGDYAAAANRLGKSEVACRVEVSRLRHYYQQMIRAVIRDTLIDPSQVDDELGCLKAALRPV